MLRLFIFPFPCSESSSFVNVAANLICFSQKKQLRAWKADQKAEPESGFKMCSRAPRHDQMTKGNLN